MSTSPITTTLRVDPHPIAKSLVQLGIALGATDPSFNVEEFIDQHRYLLQAAGIAQQNKYAWAALQQAVGIDHQNRVRAQYEQSLGQPIQQPR